MNEDDCESFKEFLSQYRCMWTENVPNKLKCGQCKLIIIDANQVRCGCNFCRNCISEMIANGTEVCPGHSEVCNQEKLSESFPDFKVNRKIMKLVVKCPGNRCGHECELSTMQQHLRLCEVKGVRCPFFHVGCDLDNITKDKMSDHLQSEAYNHNMILIEMIENLRNEMKGLKENSKMKEDTIATLNEEIRQIKMEKQQMAAEINNLKMELERKMAHLKEEMTKVCRDNLSRETKKINDEMHKLHLQLTNLFDETKNHQDRPFQALFSWRVDQLLDKRQNVTNIFSEIFYPRNDPYKMQLGMWNHANSDELNVWLSIYAGENDEHLEWPFQRNVTIQVVNNTRPNVLKRITKYCVISQPNNNSYKWDGPLEFSYAELSSTGLMDDNYFIIECCFE